MQINCSINSGQTDFVIVSKFFSIWRREEKCFKLENSLVGREGLVQEGEFFYFLMTLNFVPFFWMLFLSSPCLAILYPYKVGGDVCVYLGVGGE